MQDVEPTVELEMLTPRVGRISVSEAESCLQLPCTLHEMPTLVETFKSHNHINLIKAGDIGQGFIVHALLPDGDQTPEEALESNLAILADMEKAGTLPREIECGLTPPMVAGYVYSPLSLIHI